MSQQIIDSIFDRFPYLSADVVEPKRQDHPQVAYSNFNKTDPAQVAMFANELDGVARRWASLDTPASDDQFVKAVNGLRPMLNTVSATSLIVVHCDKLLVERPGMELLGEGNKQRRKEITALSESMLSNWSTHSHNEKLSFSRLALLGLAPFLQVELVNYSDTARVPEIMGRMLSRLDQINGKQQCEKMGAVAATQQFFDLEQQALADSDLARITIPIGTRPRIYVPKEAVTMDVNVHLAATEVLQRGRNREDSIVRFLSKVWGDFADEGFMVLHKDNKVDAYAIVGGCCYHYQADMDTSDRQPTVKGDSPPRFIGTAGEYQPHPWRRQIDRVPFDPKDKVLYDFRKGVMEREALPVEQRTEEGKTGYLAKAAYRLLNRQINYNISHVLRGEMERISTEEWSPNMCRDRYGHVYNQPHALGGVGEMFRGLLEYGDRSSQFRTWREMDGTHGFADMPRFLGYKTALDKFLLTPKVG